MDSATDHLLGTFLLAVMLALPLTAQPEPVASTSVDVEVALVTLAIRVRQADSPPLSDLQAEDLRLRVDGREVEISNLTRIGSTASRLQSGSGRSGQPQASIESLVMYVDTAFLPAGGLQALLPYLSAFLHGLPTELATMLVVADPDFRIAVGFTEDRQAIFEPLSSLGQGAARSRIETEYAQIQKQFEEVLGRASAGAIAFVPGSQADALLAQVGSFAALVQQELEGAAARLAFLVRTLEGLPGARQILFLTGPPPAHVGASLMASWREEMGQNPLFSAGATEPEAGGQDSQDAAAIALQEGSAFGSRTTAISDLDAAERLRESAVEAAAAGMSIHAVDLSASQQARTLVSTSTAGQGTAGSPRRGFSRPDSTQQDVKDLRLLKDMIEVTGGRLLEPTDLGGFLAEPSVALYSLSFVAPDGRDGEVHQLDLSPVDRARPLEVSYRHFYRVWSADQESAQATVSALLSGVQQNPLDAQVDLAVAPQAETEGLTVELRLVLPFSRIALRPDGNYHIGQLSVFSLSGEAFRSASAVQKGTLPVRIANEQMLTALGRSVEYSWELLVPAGTRTFAVGVRDDLGTLQSNLLVPLPERP